MKSKSLDQWRKYFESGNCNIYQIIFHAIRVAALDDPDEFRIRRKEIAERLYSCQFTECCCCNDQSHTQPELHATLTKVFNDCTKVNDVGDVGGDDDANVNNVNVVDSQDGEGRSGRWVDEADELGHKIEDDNDNIRHVLQIKEELENNQELTETEIYQSLRKLQLMVLSVDVMVATKIGSIVSDLRQHWSKQIRELARHLASEWTTMIKERCDNAAETAEAGRKSEPEFVNEEWREFPSAEFVPEAPAELSKFLDDMEEVENDYYPYWKDDETEERQRNVRREKKREEVNLEARMMKREKEKKEWVEKLTHCKYNERGSSSSKTKTHKIDKNVSGNKRKRESNITVTPIINRQKVKMKEDKHRDVQHAESSKQGGGCSESAMEEKLEKTKRKLHEGYEAHQKAKRNIQLIPELPRPLPKQRSSDPRRRFSRSQFRRR